MMIMLRVSKVKQEESQNLGIVFLVDFTIAKI